MEQASTAPFSCPRLSRSAGFLVPPEDGLIVSYPSRRQLAGLQIPTLVLSGTLDRMIPPEMRRRYRETLGNGHFVLVYDDAHEIGADRPEAFTSLLGDFLERHAQFVVNRTSGQLHP